ncbi:MULTISPECIES: hypothetical protein [Actinoalloteichus]|nr:MULTISPECIES: hypothetical protein [Actinoalloteichus]
MTAVFVVLGCITATPVFALIDPGVLTWTYGVASRDPMIVGLLQHRGVLQLVLGAGLVWAAFRPSVRVVVASAAILTKSVFLGLLLPDASLRADLAAFSVWFDAFCIVFLGAYVFVELLRSARSGRSDR